MIRRGPARIGAVIILYLVLTASLLIASGYRPSAASNPDAVTVRSSFYQLAYIAGQVGGNLVDSTSIVRGTTEPHDYEPSPQDIESVRRSDLFLYNGNGLDPWAENVASSMQGKGVSVRMSDKVETLRPGDPHFWLDPIRVADEARTIEKELATIDPIHADTYAANAEQLITRLGSLDHAYRTGLSSCRLHEIVTAHDAFGYLADRYGITAYPIAGLSPEEEPSSRTIANLTELVRSKKIQYVFFETLTPSTFAETVAREAGVKTLSFNPIEGLSEEDSARGATYETLMYENLQNLRIALECQ